MYLDMWPFSRKQATTPPDAGLPPATAIVHVQSAAEAMAAGSPLTVLRNLRARELEAAGDAASARELYEADVAEGTSSPHPYIRLAEIYRSAGDAASVRRVLRRAIQVQEQLGAVGEAAMFRRMLAASSGEGSSRSSRGEQAAEPDG